MADKDGWHNNKNSSDSRLQTGIDTWFPNLRGILALFLTLDGNYISSDEQQEEDSDPYIGAAYGST